MYISLTNKKLTKEKLWKVKNCLKLLEENKKMTYAYFSPQLPHSL